MSANPDSHLPVHERFLTFQGEGVHMGVKAFFIRTFGCPVRCPWCDSAGTWHPSYKPAHIDRMRHEDLAEEVEAADPAIVVLTGGEPLIHIHLPELAKLIRGKGYPVHVETCGAFYPPHAAFDWITVSPKWDKVPDKAMLHAANEFKIIVDSPDAIERWEAELDRITEIEGFLSYKNAPVWLHPEWSKRDNPEVLDAITRAVISKGSPFRAGWQLHKLYRSDALDSRSAPPVPLGGNPLLGM